MANHSRKKPKVELPESVRYLVEGNRATILETACRQVEALRKSYELVPKMVASILSNGEMLWMVAVWEADAGKRPAAHGSADGVDEFAVAAFVFEKAKLVMGHVGTQLRFFCDVELPSGGENQVSGFERRVLDGLLLLAADHRHLVDAVKALRDSVQLLLRDPDESNPKRFGRQDFRDIASRASSVVSDIGRAFEPIVAALLLAERLGMDEVAGRAAKTTRQTTTKVDTSTRTSRRAAPRTGGKRQ